MVCMLGFIGRARVRGVHGSKQASRNLFDAFCTLTSRDFPITIVLTNQPILTSQSLVCNVTKVMIIVTSHLVAPHMSHLQQYTSRLYPQRARVLVVYDQRIRPLPEPYKTDALVSRLLRLGVRYAQSCDPLISSYSETGRTARYGRARRH